MALSSGTRIGPYEIRGLLGAGGMGEVYRAFDDRLHREIALKVLPAHAANDRTRLARFEQEARSASALQHPHIVTIHDVGTSDSTAFIAMELVPGKSLRELIPDAGFPVKKALSIAVQIAEGLAAAHQKGIVHRDLKPENVIVSTDGYVKILDFGLAKLTSELLEPTESTLERPPLITQPGHIVGTSAYMSPEQVEGQPIDYRSDQFTFGTILYELLTGRRAFQRQKTIDTLSAIVNDEPPPLASRRPEVPAPLQWLIERCLAKEPAERYVSTHDLARDLRSLLTHASDLVSMERGAQKSVRRRRVSLLVALLAAAGLLAGVGAMIRPQGGPDPANFRFIPLVTESRQQDEASWSPDGQSIVYAARVGASRQIFIRRLSSPVPTQITNWKLGAWSPFLSRDASHVYATAPDGNGELSFGLWRVSVTGGEPSLLMTNIGSASASPDGRTLAVTRLNSHTGPSFQSLWFSSPDGASPKRYVAEPFASRRFWEAFIRFSPDGRKVGVLINPVGTSGQASTSEFWIIPYPSGSPYRVLQSLPDVFTRGFSWMPDSRRVVVSLPTLNSGDRCQLWTADTETGETRALVVGTSSAVNPAVSPDGRKLLYTVEEKESDIVEVPLQGGAIRDVLATSQSECDPAWSPSGRQFAFVNHAPGNAEIWLKTAGEAWARPIVTPKDFEDGPTTLFGHLEFSPDSQRIMYERYGANGRFTVWISPISGGAPVRMIKAETPHGRASWSPDGTSVAYIATVADDFILMRLKLGSDRPVPVRTKMTLGPVRWSPDGKWIAAYCTEGVCVVSPDGMQQRQLGHAAAWDYGWSRDGRTLYSVEERRPLHFTTVAYDVDSGKERVAFEFDDNSGVFQVEGLSVNPDGKSFTTSLWKGRDDIWMLEGFEPAPSLWQRIRKRLRS